MAIQYQKQYRFGRDIVAGKNITLNAENEQPLNIVIADGVTDLLVDYAADVSNAVGSAIVADGGDLTVKTNSAGTPTDTFNLVDNEAQMWESGEAGPNIFSADVTALYVTNSSGGPVTLKINIARNTA